MELKTKRLTLCPLGMKFLSSTHEYASDIENTRYMVYLPNETVEETAEFLKGVDDEWQKEKPNFYEFAILLDGKHIGAASVTLEDDTSCELGWIMNKKYWGHGFASEAAEAIVNFAAHKLGVTHFIAHCDGENIGSYRVMEKIGMKRTGYYPGRKNKSSPEDRMECLYELTVSEGK